MTTRGLTAPEQSAASARNSLSVQMIEVLFDSGALRLCLGRSEIIAGLFTFYPAKSLALDVSAESSDSLEGFKFSLTGLDMAILAIAAAEPYFRRPVLVYEQWVDANYAAVAAPRLEWIGRLTSLVIEEQGRVATVAGTAEHWDADDDRVRISYYNDATQRRLYPTDEGLSLVEQMTEVTLVWPSKEALKK
jgi:hypothetical protein